MISSSFEFQLTSVAQQGSCAFLTVSFAQLLCKKFESWATTCILQWPQENEDRAWCSQEEGHNSYLLVLQSPGWAWVTVSSFIHSLIQQTEYCEPTMCYDLCWSSNCEKDRHSPQGIYRPVEKTNSWTTITTEIGTIGNKERALGVQKEGN